ncbi:MAG: hypothetical protein A2293_15550, partial [Elusimicrobia bacterium RIFOXYB2_FULL_49_7]
IPRSTVELIYYQLDSGETKRFSKDCPFTELEAFFNTILEKHMLWAKTLQHWAEVRNTSIKELSFPFSAYRRGQRELAVSVYKTARDGGMVFAQAPTGIGKTMATLFPSVKSVGEELCQKLFYLTAKTITKTIAEQAFETMRSQGLRIKTVTITAKEKICFKPDVECDPEVCEFARGYYDRLGDALQDMFSEDSFDRARIEAYARTYTLCPFELSLDMSLWVDAVIADYNYAFDPRAHLRRYFDESNGKYLFEKYVFLVDEAHNLVDRAREMFSAELSKDHFLAVKQACGRSKKRVPPRLRRLHSSLSELVSCFKEVHAQCQENCFYRSAEVPETLSGLLWKFVRHADEALSVQEKLSFHQELLDLYLEAQRFIRTAETAGECYTFYAERSERGDQGKQDGKRGRSSGEVKVKLFCIDPAPQLKAMFRRAYASVLFSATLSPMEYFIKVVGGDEGAVTMSLTSPFPKENLLVLFHDRISTRYKMRSLSYDAVAEAIAAVARAKAGNYLVYFPSYRYMNEVYERFCLMKGDIHALCQRSSMTEQERQVFLNEFSSFGERTLAGFAVMGGVFGEGIDLVGERLSGVVVVGVGLPQVCLEREIVKEYYQNADEAGFEFAYTYPGMNKVLQAVGRVIRTETDKGVVLLIDDRFTTPLYRKLSPPGWLPFRRAGDPAAIESRITKFWNGDTDAGGDDEGLERESFFDE